MKDELKKHQNKVEEQRLADEEKQRQIAQQRKEEEAFLEVIEEELKK